MSQILELLHGAGLKAPLIAADATVAGRATIASGSTTLAVTNAAVAADSVVILTSNTDVASHVDLVATVASQSAGVGFTVKVNKATVNSHVVNWWLVRAS